MRHLKECIANTILLRNKPVPAMSADEVAAEVERNYGWNFTVNLLDGVTFWFGNSFASVSTIIPLFMSKLTMNPLVFAVIAMIAQGGWYFPQLLAAGHTERLPWKKPIVVNAGFFLERLPLWIWPLAALIAPRYPLGAVWLFLLGFAWHTLGAGVIAPAWQDMLARCFQVTRRGRFFGLTTFLGTGSGALGALVSSWLLKTYAFPLNFVLTFLITAVAINLSWGFLALTREPVEPVGAPPPPEYAPLWRRFHEIVTRDRNFRRFLRARFVSALGMMAQGFLTVAVIRRWQVPDSTVALYTGTMLIGQAAGNLGSGLLADRVGYKFTLELGICANTLAFLLAWIAPSALWFYGVFALLGIAIGARLVSEVMISMEFSPAAQRPTYIGIANTVAGIGGGLAPLLGGWIANYSYAWLFALSSVVGVSSFILMHWCVKEPRHHSIHR